MKLTLKIVFFLISIKLVALSSVIGTYKTYTVISDKKQTPYYILQSGEKIKIKLDEYSTVYIRAIPQKNISSYYFKIIQRGYEKTYKRKIKISKKVAGKNGEKLSELTKIKNRSGFVVIKNISDIPILIRIKEKYKNITFVSVSPQKFGKTENIKIKEKQYTYYTANDEISLDVKGKAYLKIISRNSKKDDYSYSVVLDNRPFKTEFIKFKPSKYAKNLSKGSIKIYEIPKGKHHISIKADKNVLFRFFINKKAVRLIK